VDTLADPEHEEHEERLEWLGLEAAGPVRTRPAFEPVQVNRDLADLATVLVNN